MRITLINVNVLLYSFKGHQMTPRLVLQMKLQHLLANLRVGLTALKKIPDGCTKPRIIHLKKVKMKSAQLKQFPKMRKIR